MPKKADNSEPPKEEILVKKVDEMMDIERPDADVSELAAEFNQKFLSEKPEAKPVIKTETPKTAPELPSELKVEPVEEAVVEPVPEAKEPIAEPETAANPDEAFEDQKTDEAVDDIVAKEGDVVLAVEDKQRERKSNPGKPTKSWKTKLKSLVRNKWTWVVIGLLIAILFAVPTTRYKLAGLLVKKSVIITVIDSKTSTPVSNADVSLGGNSTKTDASGKAVLKTGVGDQSLTVSKKYYRELEANQFVGFKDFKPAPVKLVATGRLVPVTVLNKITGKPVSGAQIKVLGTTAKTNAKGLATIALPADKNANPGKLSLGGYNPIDVTVQTTDQKTKANTFELTPSGQVYFLSNRSGTLDVVKTNLDGSGRKTVVEGTGREDVRTTSLLASRDWRYLVLKSRREGNKDALYLIETATDKVTKFDSSEADFTLVGWYDKSFVYALTNASRPAWQSGQQAVKSYDAETQQLSLLDQSQAEGDGNSYSAQNFSNFYIVKGAVVYNTQWYSYASGSIEGKNDTIRAISPTGQNKKDYQTFPTKSTGFMQASLYEPQGIYYAVYDNTTFKTNFYVYENQTVQTANIDQAKFDQPYPTFLLSPSGSQTFWTELRDGKNTLFTGDASADSKKQISSSSDYAPYGWYSDGYNLVSKNNSELYIMSTKSPTKQLKITDYYKPAQSYPGYGYGYGGL